jgi:hypothetical protein
MKSVLTLFISVYVAVNQKVWIIYFITSSISFDVYVEWFLRALSRMDVSKMRA